MKGGDRFSQRESAQRGVAVGVVAKEDEAVTAIGQEDGQPRRPRPDLSLRVVGSAQAQVDEVGCAAQIGRGLVVKVGRTQRGAELRQLVVDLANVPRRVLEFHRDGQVSRPGVEQ